MQLNFMGLLVIGAGIVALGLGINGSYQALFQSITGGVTPGQAGQPENAQLPGVNTPGTPGGAGRLVK